MTESSNENKLNNTDTQKNSSLLKSTKQSLDVSETPVNEENKPVRIIRAKNDTDTSKNTANNSTTNSTNSNDHKVKNAVTKVNKPANTQSVENQLQRADENIAELSDSKIKKLGVDLEYMDDMRSALLIQKPNRSKLLLYLICSIFVIGLLWAHFAIVDEVTVAEAKVIPSSREQLIQSLEGGIIESIEVREGSIVKKGDILAVIDATRAEAYLRETESKLFALEAQAARFRAEANQVPLDFPEHLKALTDIIVVETDAYNARIKGLEDSLQALEVSYELINDEIQLSEPLSARGLISDVEMLRMRRQANDIRLQIIDKKNQFSSQANADLSRVESEIGQIKENLIARKDIVERSTLRSPVDGIVTTVEITTIGGVVPQGGEIMRIVPTQDELLLEAKVKPTDMAFLKVGGPAVVKISAYDYAIYGGLDGIVEHISSDAIDEKDANEQRKGITSYYRVLVRTNKSYLERDEKRFDIIPGMTGIVQIKTGKKSILSYILKPILKSQEAFRER
ncbi:HlyD family type I secretion periplasmic adaptor subunit [Thorsellia kenyensis]|uniref:Membrane fusion protein (MFP) family protein n=1 Tax=Thorsellia kenyensis TaxID=1549888 RepID=A0ABV6CA65_9GAMM